MAATAYTGTLEYIVPNGVVAVVRNITAVEQGLSGAVLQLQGTAGPVWDFQAPSTALYQEQLDCRQVFYPLEIFKMAVLSGTWYFTVSGFLLTLP
jgi:hypothetical protein